jgi:LPXTG-site transpeptidase (sortase) family protein
MNNLPDRKQSNRIVKNLFFIVGIPFVSCCAMFLLLHTYIHTQHSLIVTTEQPHLSDSASVVNVSVLPPVQLKIPSIGVDALIKPSGLTPEGDMAIDDSIDSVAWYKLGIQPGQKGSAVIAGHYGWKDGQPSVFNNLYTLKSGDMLMTINQSKGETKFSVIEVRRYDPHADATRVFRSNDGRAHLNLISCIGTWESSERTYSQRLVVFADEIVDK